MPTDPFFQMTVEDVFFIKGRGTVVTGRIEAGTINTGDEIFIRRGDNKIKTVVSGIEMFRKVLNEAKAGDNVGLLLRNVTKEQVGRGDLVVGVA